MTWVEEAGGASMRGFMLSEKDIRLDCLNSWRDQPTQDNGLFKKKRKKKIITRQVLYSNFENV